MSIQDHFINLNDDYNVDILCYFLELGMLLCICLDSRLRFASMRFLYFFFLIFFKSQLLTILP